MARQKGQGVAGRGKTGRQAGQDRQGSAATTLTDVLQLSHLRVAAKVEAGARQAAPPLLKVLPKGLPLRQGGRGRGQGRDVRGGEVRGRVMSAGGAARAPIQAGQAGREPPC